jgi:hypothetical protein
MCKNQNNIHSIITLFLKLLVIDIKKTVNITNNPQENNRTFSFGKYHILNKKSKDIIEIII